MIMLSLIAGALLGAISVIFVWQNVTDVTVTFFAWHLTGSLALVLFATLLAGIIITLLVLLPSLIRDEIYLASIRKQKQDLEDELAKQKVPQPVPPATS